MNIPLRRVRCLNVLQNFQFSSRDGSHNLKREYSILSAPSKDQYYTNNLLNIECNRVPSRNFYKHEVEVFKRINWKRPVKVPSILPEKSGDLSGLAPVDLEEPPPLFKESSEYQSASDLVKRVLSLKFQPPAAKKQANIAAMTQKVKRHQYDSDSVEVKIAKWTAIIRNMQIHTSTFPYDRSAKADLKELIEFRKKRMKLLRTLDYRRFEWLLESLDLLFKPAPSSHERVERKKSMRWLAADYIENVKQKKLEDYRNLLDSKKLNFLQSKLNTIKAIVEEEKAFGVEPSFSAEEIAQAEEELRARTLEETRKSAREQTIQEVY